MDGWLKALVAATCVAVLAALGWWGWQEREEARAVAEARSEVASEAARLSSHETGQRLAECQEMIALWDAGNRSAVAAEHGYEDGTALTFVNDCRELVAK